MRGERGERFNLAPIILAARGRSGRAEFYIIPQPAIFVKSKTAQRSRRADPEICAICTVDFWVGVCYYNYRKRGIEYETISIRNLR